MNHLSKKTPKQLSLEIDQETHSRIIASSSLNFQIELILDIGTNEVFNALQYSRRHSSLDAPFSDGEDSSLINVIEDEQEKDPDNKVMDTSMKEEIASALSTLTDRERSVIEMYFGINRDRSFTLNEIGEQFNLTRERVRQIKEKAIRRLAHKTRSEPLRVYLGQ